MTHHNIYILERRISNVNTRKEVDHIKLRCQSGVIVAATNQIKRRKVLFYVEHKRTDLHTCTRIIELTCDIHNSLCAVVATMQRAREVERWCHRKVMLTSWLSLKSMELGRGQCKQRSIRTALHAVRCSAQKTLHHNRGLSNVHQNSSLLFYSTADCYDTVQVRYGKVE